MRIYAYLRASTDEQDSLRAKESLINFSKERGFNISSFYVENVSGASLDRPELWSMINHMEQGDVILVEHIDRLSRLNYKDWKKLRIALKEKEIKVASIDLPASHTFLSKYENEMQERIMDAVNDMFLEMLAAVARSDYETRRERQRQGIEKAKRLKKFKGAPKNMELRKKVNELLPLSWSMHKMAKTLNCSSSTIHKILKEFENESRV